MPTNRSTVHCRFLLLICAGLLSWVRPTIGKSQDVIYSQEKSKAEERWRRFDKNGDGKLDDEEQKAFRQELFRNPRILPAPTVLPIFMEPAARSRPVPELGPMGEIRQIQTGFSFTEGPAAGRRGILFFTDLTSNRILGWGGQGKAEVLVENTRGICGLAVDSKGRWIGCRGEDGSIVRIDPSSKRIEVLAKGYQGLPFNEPNDLVLDSRGGIYFTDPSFRLRNQKVDGVYYFSPQRRIFRLIEDVDLPNGVALSPREDILYVLSSGAGALMAYPVIKPGRIGPGVRLGRVPVAGDGLTVDSLGNLYVTQPRAGSILILSPRGQELGLLTVPEPPSNCEFGGSDGKDLFITARKSLYCYKMKVAGISFRPATKNRK